ncbi:MAG: 50S ribosomal protein L4 [Bacteroidales bacterium]|nr:50S ribosomal protein L4 [Bacteroidales bacterium]
MEVVVKNISGVETSRKINLDETIFGIEPNDHAIYLDVKQYLANNRQGTHKAKEKGEVRKSTRKLKKQKGTGGARAGSMKNPLYKGGGRVFGPRPRDYSFKLNKKLKQLARRSALTYKFQENNITVLEDFNFESPKTKEICTLKNNLKLNDKKSILILPKENKNIYLSSRNLQDFEVVVASELNTYAILKAKNVLILESSVAEIEKNLK